MIDEDEFLLGEIFIEQQDAVSPATPSLHLFKREFTRQKDESSSYDEVKSLQIGLVGHHSLWAHCLWNAGVALAKYIDAHPKLVKGKHILELGAGGALPSLITALNDAEKIIITDYPDQELIETIKTNIQTNLPKPLQTRVSTKGFRWDDKEVLAELLDLTPEKRGYDVILMSDLIFNHSQHQALLQSSHALLRKDSSDSEIYSVFTHHIPKYKDRDLGIFRLAQIPGFGVVTTNDEKNPNLQKPCFHVEYLHTEIYPVMFEEDPGDAKIRSEIQFYKLTIAANTK